MSDIDQIETIEDKDTSKEDLSIATEIKKGQDVLATYASADSPPKELLEPCPGQGCQGQSSKPENESIEIAAPTELLAICDVANEVHQPDLKDGDVKDDHPMETEMEIKANETTEGIATEDHGPDAAAAKEKTDGSATEDHGPDAAAEKETKDTETEDQGPAAAASEMETKDIASEINKEKLSKPKPKKTPTPITSKVKAKASAKSVKTPETKSKPGGKKAKPDVQPEKPAAKRRKTATPIAVGAQSITEAMTRASKKA